MSKKTPPAPEIAPDRQDAQSWRRIGTVSGLVVFVFSLALYVWTLAPTVTLVDSGELIVAARTLGVAHPPGFPLYVLLAHLASLVPLGSVAARVNFASAILAALATTAVTLGMLELIRAGRRGSSRAESKGGKRKSAAIAAVKSDPIQPDWVDCAPALLAGLLFCASRTLWAYATIAEVYTLNSLLISLVLLFMARWRRLILEEREQNTNRASSFVPTPDDRWLYAAALAFGLALGVHHVTVGLMLPALAVLSFATEGRRTFAARRLLFAAAWAVAGLGVYLYLPLAAARSPIMNWGDPRTLGRFLAHVTGWQYRVYFEPQPELIGRQFADFFTRALHEFGPSWLPVALAAAAAGFVYLFRHVRPVFWCLITAVAANLAYNVNYEIAEDKDAYYLPVFLVIAFAAAFGARFLMESVAKKSLRGIPLRRAVAGACLLAIPAVAFAANYTFDNRHNYFIARDYVENILAAVPPGGMLLTLDWQVYSPMFYLRELEGYRRDAVVIDINQLRRSWYFDYLERTYPRTLDQARVEVDGFLEDLRRWERDPEAYERDAGLNRRISARFQALILTLAANHARTAAVCVTQDIATYPAGGPDSYWAGKLTANYQLVPDGLVFRLYGDQGFHEPAHPALVTRGLVDGTLRFAEDDVVTVKVLPVYANMNLNRGRYLATAGRHEAAIKAFEEALAIDPALSAAREAIMASRAALRQPN